METKKIKYIILYAIIVTVIVYLVSSFIVGNFLIPKDPIYRVILIFAWFWITWGIYYSMDDN